MNSKWTGSLLQNTTNISFSLRRSTFSAANISTEDTGESSMTSKFLVQFFGTIIEMYTELPDSFRQVKRIETSKQVAMFLHMRDKATRIL